MLQGRRTAIITDAAHPAAKIIARRLESGGITVIRNYPRKADLSAAEMGEYIYAMDTCSLNQMESLLKAVIQKTGDIHYLVHTDNVVFRAPIETIPEEDFRNTVDQNAKSAFITTKVFGPHIVEGGGGAILYLSSFHDEKPTGCAFAYSVGKGAVKMLCKEMALFLGRKGVRVNLIQMGCLLGEVPQFESFITPFRYDAETKIPLGRLGDPQDVAGLAEFLLSDEASFINGAEVRVDGGHLMYYIDR